MELRVFNEHGALFIAGSGTRWPSGLPFNSNHSTIQGNLKEVKISSSRGCNPAWQGLQCTFHTAQHTFIPSPRSASKPLASSDLEKKTNPNTHCSGPAGSTSSVAYVALPCRDTAVCPHMWPLTQGEDLGRRKMLSKPHGHLFMCCRMVTQPW